MIRTFLERRRIKRVFGKVVNPETVEALVRGDTVDVSLKHGRIEFILAFVRGDGPAQVSDRIDQVAKLAVAHGAVIHQIVGALVVMAFGTTPAGQESGSRSSLVPALAEVLARDVKIVHGAGEGHYGLFGTREHSVSFTFLVPEFDQALGALSRLAFGAVEELRS